MIPAAPSCVAYSLKSAPGMPLGPTVLPKAVSVSRLVGSVSVATVPIFCRCHFIVPEEE